jgi:hypothetical protein
MPKVPLPLSQVEAKMAEALQIIELLDGVKPAMG